MHRFTFSMLCKQRDLWGRAYDPDQGWVPERLPPRMNY